jgi:hypothetical protein
MSRILHVAGDGSDWDGDGTARRPYRTVTFAQSVAQPGDVLTRDYVYTSPADLKPVRSEFDAERYTFRDSIHATQQRRAPGWLILGAALASWALVGFVSLVVMAAVRNPSLAVLIVGVAAVLFACVTPERGER